MSNEQPKKQPTEEDVLRRLLQTPPAPFTPKKPQKPAKTKKK